MMKQTTTFILLVLLCTGLNWAQVPDGNPHPFTLGPNDFLFDGQPMQLIAGELHPARIHPAYWRHRIRMAKAIGCNAIAVYLFWNYHETGEGIFDFSSPERDIKRFIQTVAEEKMWVLVRPGPYVCGEWDFGGIPPYLLKDPEIRVRCRDPRYMEAVERYIKRMAEELKPLQVNRGGPILMMQIENEYGSYGNDRAYLFELEKLWRHNGIEIPFFTADGPTPYMLEAGTLPGAAIGLDSGSNADDFALAQRLHPGVPVFSSETYPGWLTHWGEKWARPDANELYKEVRFLLENKKSFNFYVIHGGTNFGFSAGANSGGKGYEPDITSYDYDAPIDEQGRPTPKYHALRALISEYLPASQRLPAIPKAIDTITVPAFKPSPFAPLLDSLSPAIEHLHPKPFEHFDQNQGLVLYRTRLIGRKKGKLMITDPHDYVLVYLDGQYIGTIDRRLGENTIDIPESSQAVPQLDLLVEGMGHINFAQYIIDRKGISDRVTLSGMTLMNWSHQLLPLDRDHIERLTPSAQTTHGPKFFKGRFTLKKVGDTFLDMSAWSKGVVWVNGHNLGRFWSIGPQLRLFCPGPYLKKGENEILVLDLHRSEAAEISGLRTMNE